MMVETQRERAERYAAAWVDGASLREIGTAEGFTYERIRQVMSDHPDIYESAKLQRASRRVWRLRDEAELKARRLQSARALNPKQHTRVYTTAALEAWIEMFRVEHEPPYSSSAFGHWLRANGGPAPRTFQIRFGLWRDLVKRFDMEHPAGSPTGVTPKTLEEGRSALLAVAMKVGRYPTTEDYEAHRPPGSPSLGTLRERLSHDGRWHGALLQIMPHTLGSLRYRATNATTEDSDS